MPYQNRSVNVTIYQCAEELWDKMDSCVDQVMAKGQDKETAISICHAQIVGGKSMEDAMHQFILERAEIKLISFGSEVKALAMGGWAATWCSSVMKILPT